jgi:DNA-binding CsgD family transcriptional regulator
MQFLVLGSRVDFGRIFFELAASVDQVVTVEDLTEFIRKILSEYELKHAVYYQPGLAGHDEVNPISIITYEDDWVRRYFEMGYLEIDPVVLEGFAGLLPVDWSGLDKRPPRVRQLFGESGEFGIGRQGLTFPLRGPNGEAALFSITSDLPDDEWQKAKLTYVRDVQVLAHTIHAKAMVIAGGPAPDYKARLTPRERECLTWSAVGKTSEDVATILGISEGVVRIHLQSAQHKLNCLNRTHTVAKAIAHKLIFPDLR